MLLLNNLTLYIIYNLQTVLTLALLFFCLYLYVSFIWRNRRIFIKSWNFPGPLNFPVIGGAYIFMTRPECIIDRITNQQEKFPKGFKLWFGNQLYYFLNEPEHIQKILGSSSLLQKHVNMYKNLTDAMGQGLLTAPPLKWKKHKKIIQPSFNQKVLDSFVQIFAEQGLILTEVLEDTYEKKIDILGILTRCTLDIVCESTMGIQLKSQKTNSKYGQVFDEILSLVFLKIAHLWNNIDFIWKILGHDKKLKGYLKQFNELVDLVINQKMEAKEAKRRRNSSSTCIEGPLKRMAFLDILLECGQFDARELRDEVNIFLFAGTDTTASALSFLFAVLGMFPEVQDRVLEEVIEVIGNDRSPEYQDLPHMIYTERVIKETLRLFPVAGIFLRDITEDVDMGDFIVPQGASALFSLVFIHRNPKYWPDPLKFDPDRFLPEEVAKRHPCTYIPFSFGPRNCIGQKYGMMNMKVILSTVIRKFRINCEYKKIEDIKLRANIVLRIQNGTRVSVTPRK